VLRLRIFDTLSTIIEEKGRTQLNGKIIFDIGCYNSNLFKWEPVVERFGAKVELSLQEAPKINLTLSNLEGFNTLNVNISDHMVIYFLLYTLRFKGSNHIFINSSLSYKVFKSASNTL